MAVSAHAREPAPPLESCARLLTNFTYRLGIRDYAVLYSQMQGERSFQRFLRLNPQNPQSDEDYREAILKYFVDYSMRFDEAPAVQRLRRMALAKSLKTRGHALTDADAYRSLAIISKTNLDRAKRDYPYTSEPEMKVFEEFIDRVTPLHVHNSLHVKSGIPIPLLSFNRLRDLGMGTDGFLSDSWFNREFLGTTDEIFFHVQFGRVEQNESTRHYGNHQLVLDSDFADRYGVISPFVMYPENLLAFAKLNSPVEYEQLKAKLLALDPSKTNELKVLDEMRRHGKEEEFVRQNLSAFRNIKDKLGAFDFTRPDFQLFVRQVFLSRLQAIRRENPERFERIVGMTTDYYAWQLVRDFVYGPLGFPRGFEFRLPIAIPPRALQDRQIEE